MIICLWRRSTPKQVTHNIKEDVFRGYVFWHLGAFQNHNNSLFGLGYVTWFVVVRTIHLFIVCMYIRDKIHMHLRQH